MKKIDLNLTQEGLEVVTEISTDEWIKRYNAMCKEYGPCFGPHELNLKFTSVKWVDEEVMESTFIDLNSYCETDSYGESAWMNEDIMKLIEGKTITIENGGFHMTLPVRKYGLEFTSVDGEKFRYFMRFIPRYLSGNYIKNSKADKKDLGIQFLAFVNNPRRLAVNSDIGGFRTWTSDYTPCHVNKEVFCLNRMTTLLKEEIDELLSNEKCHKICEGCKMSDCPVSKKFYKD